MMRPVIRTIVAIASAVAAACSRDDPPPQALQYVHPQMRERIDPARDRVWILAPTGIEVRDVHRRGQPRRIALPDWQWVGLPYSCPPDLALGPGGAVYATSDILAHLWRVDPDTLVVSRHEPALDADTHKDVGFSALVHAGDQVGLFAMSYAHGSLWWIDHDLATARKLHLPSPIPGACALTIRPRGGDPEPAHVVSLCARTYQGRIAVDVDLDRRTARKVAATCQ